MSFWTGTQWEQDAPASTPRRSSHLRHVAEVVAEGTLVALLVTGLVAGTAFAARTRTADIQLAGVDSRLSADAEPSLGSAVFFDVVVPSNVNNPRVVVNCYQGDELVYGEGGSVGQATGDGSDSLGYSGFLLGGGGSTWKDRGGEADCVATLFYYSQKAGKQTFNALDSTSFHAGA